MKNIRIPAPKLSDLKFLNLPKPSRTVKEAATVVPQIGYAAWDIAVSDDDVQLIEGNQYSGYDIYQMPCHITDGYGILPVLNKAIGKE